MPRKSAGPERELSKVACGNHFKLLRMDYKILSATLDEPEYLFFAATFKHRTTFYKVAVAEQFSVSEQGYSGVYCVLMQSGTGTCTFLLHKNDKNVWKTNVPQLSPEIVFLIGTQIDTIKR